MLSHFTSKEESRSRRVHGEIAYATASRRTVVKGRDIQRVGVIVAWVSNFTTGSMMERYKPASYNTMKVSFPVSCGPRKKKHEH